jgi:hypothetical protein
VDQVNWQVSMISNHNAHQRPESCSLKFEGTVPEKKIKEELAHVASLTTAIISHFLNVW